MYSYTSIQPPSIGIHINYICFKYICIHIQHVFSNLLSNLKLSTLLWPTLLQNKHFLLKPSLLDPSKDAIFYVHYLRSIGFFLKDLLEFFKTWFFFLLLSLLVTITINLDWSLFNLCWTITEVIVSKDQSP